MKKYLVFLAACTLPAVAQATPYPVAHPTGFDPYASEAIMRADFDSAEARLTERLDANSNDIAALLNLAAVMSETNRVARASSLLEQVLESENVLLEGVDGTPVWSHQAATAVLRGRVTIGSR